jgi:tetratricopeptide (TPR) repeat protein
MGHLFLDAFPSNSKLGRFDRRFFFRKIYIFFLIKLALIIAPLPTKASGNCNIHSVDDIYIQALEAFISKDFTDSTKLYKSLLSCPMPRKLSSSIHLGLGRNYHELSLKEESLKEYSLALQLNDSLHQGYTNRGLVLASLGRLNEAINDFNKAIGLNSRSYISLTNRGVAYATLGKFSRAIKDFDSALAINSNFGEAYLNRGIMFELTGDLNRACSDWKKALTLRQFSAKSWIDLQCTK